MKEKFSSLLKIFAVVSILVSSVFLALPGRVEAATCYWGGCCDLSSSPGRVYTAPEKKYCGIAPITEGSSAALACANDMSTLIDPNLLGKVPASFTCTNCQGYPACTLGLYIDNSGRICQNINTCSGIGPYVGVSGFPEACTVLNHSCYTCPAGYTGNVSLGPFSCVLITYALTINTAGTGSGSVTGAGNYVPGTVVTASASPDANSVFSGWSGNCNASGQVTMSANKTCTATFTALPSFEVYAEKLGGIGAGTITSNVTGLTCSNDGINPTSCDCDTSCSYIWNTYFASSTVVLTASSSAGYSFSGWSKYPDSGYYDCTASSTNTCTFNMNNNKGVYANFVSAYTLTVTKSGGTTLEKVTSNPAGINCTSGTCSASFNANANVVLTATSSPGYVFAGWSGVCSGTSTCTVPMTANKAVTATFNLSFPQNITSAPSCSNSGILLSWTPVNGATGYKIYKNGVSLVATTSTSVPIIGILGTDYFQLKTVVGMTESPLSASTSLQQSSAPGLQPTKAQAAASTTYTAGTLHTPTIPIVTTNPINGGSSVPSGSLIYLTGNANITNAESQYLHADYYYMRESSTTWTLATSSNITTSYVLSGPNQVSRTDQYSIGPITAESSGGSHTVYYYVGAYPYCINNYQAENSWRSGLQTYTVSNLPIPGICGPAASTTYIYPSGSSSFLGPVCTSGTSSPAIVSFPNQGQTIPWQCLGLNGSATNSSCSATRAAPIVTGTCGTASSTYASNATDFNWPLCNTGTSTVSSPVFPLPGNSVTWVCQGTDMAHNSPLCGAYRGNYTLSSNLNCSVNLTIPAHGTAKINSNTTWAATTSPACPTCLTTWQIYDGVSTTTPSSGTPAFTLDNIFTTIGNKRVSVTFASTSAGTIGNPCTATENIWPEIGKGEER